MEREDNLQLLTSESPPLSSARTLASRRWEEAMSESFAFERLGSEKDMV